MTGKKIVNFITLWQSIVSISPYNCLRQHLLGICNIVNFRNQVTLLCCRKNLLERYTASSFENWDAATQQAFLMARPTAQQSPLLSFLDLSEECSIHDRYESRNICYLETEAHRPVFQEIPKTCSLSEEQISSWQTIVVSEKTQSSEILFFQ